VRAAIDNQSRNPSLKPPPLYFDGAVTEALVEGKKSEVSSCNEETVIEKKPVQHFLKPPRRLSNDPEAVCPEHLWHRSVVQGWSLARKREFGSAGVDVPGAPATTERLHKT